MREIWSKIVFSSGAQAYSLLVNLVSLSLTARWLGPEGRGVFVAILTWVNLFAVFGHLSLGSVAIHRATEFRGQSWLPSTLGSLIVLDVFLTVIGWTVASLLYLFGDGRLYNGLALPLLAIGFLALPLAIWETYGSALLMATDKYSLYNRAQIIGRTSGLVLILVVWWLGGDISGVLIANLISQVLVSGIGMGYIFQQAEVKPQFSWVTTKELMVGGLQLHWNAVGTFMISSTDILIINFYRGPAEAGFYQLALRMLAILFVVPSAATKIMHGKVAKLGPDQAWLYQRKVLILLTGGMILSAIVAALVAPWVVPLVAGDEFAGAVPVFQLLLVTVVGVTFSAVMAPQWIGRGLFWQASAVTFAIGLGNLIAGLLLVPRYGIYGSVYGTLITYTLSIFINGGMAIRCELQTRKVHVPAIVEE